MWEREERFELVFCVPQTSLPASSAPVPCEPPVWNHACLGLRGGSAYVRPSVSPAATGSPAAVGVERGSGSVCCTTLRRSLPTLKRQRNVLLFLTQLPTPTAVGGAWWVTPTGVGCGLGAPRPPVLCGSCVCSTFSGPWLLRAPALTQGFVLLRAHSQSFANQPYTHIGIGSEAKNTGFEIRLCHSPAVWPWAGQTL